MKKILIPLLLLASIALNAQTINLELSKEFTFKEKGSSIYTSVLKVGDFFYDVDVDYKGMQFAYTAKLEKVRYGITIHKYTTDMKEAGNYAIGSGKDYGPFPAKMIVYNQALVVVYYQVREGNGIQLLMTIIDPVTLKEKVTRELYNVSEKNVGLWSTYEVMNKNNLIITPSPNEDKLLICQSGNTNEMFTCVLNKSFEVEKSTITPLRGKLTDVKLNNSFIDNTGNIYLSYTYVVDKLNYRGIFAQNTAGKNAFVDYKGDKTWGSNVLFFHQSVKTGQLLLYANYYGDYLDEGLLTTSFNLNDFKFGKANYFAYSDDIKQKMSKAGYGAKNKSLYSVRRIDFICNELEDGTVAFSGTPIFKVGDVSYSGKTTTVIYAGPIVNFFVKNDNYTVNVIYRDIRELEPAGVIAAAYKNSLVLIYNDGPKNITIKDSTDYSSEKDASDLVLAAAVMSSNGALVSKKQISGDVIGSNYFYTSFNKQVANNRFIIPIGRERVNLARYYTEFVQWGTVTIQ